MAFDPISTALDLGSKVIDRLWPDPAQRDAAKLKLLEMQQSGELARLAADTDLVKAAASIVEAEAKSEGWLTRSWRPITMLVFVALLVARMFGLTAEGITEAEYTELWGLMKLGLGGYVFTRGGKQMIEAAGPVVAALKGAAK
jgi:hypothetical protein